MAIMTDTRTLRDGPSGSAIGSAPKGALVDVIDASTRPWIKVQLLGLPGKPVGFVTDDAVNTAATMLPPLDKLSFANECDNQEIIYGVSAHYMMAIAELRTDVIDGPRPGGSGDTGPFALLPNEWKFFCSRPEFLLDFDESDINDWQSQCAVFAVMTYLAQNKLAIQMTAQPTPTELYFSQLVGTKAAITGIAKPDQQLSELITNVSTADFQTDGIDSGRIIARSAGLLNNNASVKDTLEQIATKLQKALDDTRQFLVQVGAQPIPDPAKPLSKVPSDSVISPPPGDSEVDTACKVIAKFEGYQQHAYWDVNHWRVGYGSDTYCTKGPGGEWQEAEVLKDTVTNRDAAYANLVRRVTRFETKTIEQVGPNTWNKLPVGTRSALVSVAYNYGSLPKNIAAALSTGDTTQIANAILAHRGDNQGVNRKRRTAEANIVIQGHTKMA
jgi:GH24 family phage-related lysozyme (muramidase)